MFTQIRDRIRPYLPRNIRYTLYQKRERQFAETYVFSSNPAVVCLTWMGFRTALHDEMKDRRLTALYVFFFWMLPEEVAGMAQKIKTNLARYPKHRVVMLCNERFVADLFCAEGVEAIFCNHNCLINETYFTIDETAVKKYDAIYNAAMSGYKRHPLAAKIDSLALITYRYAGTYAADYEKEVRACLGHAVWLVDAYEDSQKAPPAEVARYNNQCRVGLCLSAREGAMFASIEYLLCGLPVVTTKNLGGRDAFFEPEYVEWVEDNPDAVRQGVVNVLARAPEAAVIRRRVIEKMEEHRQRLRDLLRDDLPNVEMPWKPGNIGPLSRRHLRELGRQLRRGVT